jgi:hypothetical protein
MFALMASESPLRQLSVPRRNLTACHVNADSEQLDLNEDVRCGSILLIESAMGGLLNERFARGEIKKEEYAEKKAAILSGG